MGCCMSTIMGSELTVILTGFMVLLMSVLWYVKYRFKYWERLGVKTMPTQIPFGDITDVFFNKKCNLGMKGKEIYDVMKAQGQPFAGGYMFSSPALIPVSIDLVKNIMQNDFTHFGERGFYVNEDADPLSGNLFSLGMEKWRVLRTKLTPTFTSGKMKMMFHTITGISGGLEELLKSFHEEKKPIDVKEVYARFNTDVIGSCAFGIECNSLKNPHAKFRIYGEKTFEPKLRGLLPLLLPHDLLRMLRVQINDSETEDFFMGIVKETVDYREKNNVVRNDFMQLLIQLKNDGFLTEDGNVRKRKAEESNENKEDYSREKLTMNEVAAQCFVFFNAGYETSSTTTTFAVYELAIHQDIQEKVRQEICTILEEYGGNITYEGVMRMTYLEQIVCETLRKYPPVAVINRLCTKYYNIPGTNVTVEKGTTVLIPVLGIHYDPEYYENPEEFRPERFNEENKKNRLQYTWLPFGDGPRICIGLRFGMLQVKVGLVTLLRNYRVTLNEKTKTPLEYVPIEFITTAKGGIWVNLESL